jgi:hypothetical protein
MLTSAIQLLTYPNKDFLTLVIFSSSTLGYTSIPKKKNNEENTFLKELTVTRFALKPVLWIRI